MPDKQPQISQRTIIGVIMGGLVAWAIYLAVGAYLYDLNILRAVIVLACMAAFLGFWLLMLWTQGPRTRRD
jgi:high-affinity Fe2+/Pb2+ permease